MKSRCWIKWEWPRNHDFLDVERQGMIYRVLGKTGLNTSLLSLGTGGARKLGQTKGLSLLEQKKLVYKAFELGVNFIDTATSYDKSEQILGKILKDIQRQNYFLATKWAPRQEYDELGDEKQLELSVDASLRKLKTDCIDVMFLHGLLPGDYETATRRFYPKMMELKKKGKIRFLGFSTRFKIDHAQEAAKKALSSDPEIWDVIMLKYGILNQNVEKEILPLALKHNVGIMNMAAVRVKLPDPELLEKLIQEWKQKGLVDTNAIPDRKPLDWLIHHDVTSVIDAGYRFAAEPFSISTVISGTANINHLEKNAQSLEKPHLPEEDSQRLKEVFSHIVQYA